ncbi:unnamed protein product [Closterium sp. Yama58-4]|nr:unnamed protein product [Closterium sp. Yama58-4]
MDMVHMDLRVVPDDEVFFAHQVLQVRHPPLLRSLPIAVQYLQMGFLEKLGTFFIGMDMVHMDLRVVPDDEVAPAALAAQGGAYLQMDFLEKLGTFFISMDMVHMDLRVVPDDEVFFAHQVLQASSCAAGCLLSAQVRLLTGTRNDTRAPEQHGEVVCVSCARISVFVGSVPNCVSVFPLEQQEQVEELSVRVCCCGLTPLCFETSHNASFHSCAVLLAYHALYCLFPGAPADWVVVLAQRYNTRALEQHGEVEEPRCVCVLCPYIPSHSLIFSVLRCVFPGAPADWVVVLARRYNTRALEQHGEVEELLSSLFPRERVVVFDGSLRISDAKALFNRAVLFVAAHGAAITNAIFMPFKSVLLELRPRDFHKACYHHLAEVCDLQYFLLLCEGAKDTPLSCDMGEVRSLLEEVRGRVDKVLEEGPEVQLEEEDEGQR